MVGEGKQGSGSVTHPYNMQMAQSCQSTCSLNESKKNNKNIKNPFTYRKEKKNVIILHCILKFAEITVLCRDDGSVN